jgi:hypothetical protein
MTQTHGKILELHRRKERKGKTYRGNPRRKSRAPPHVHTKPTGCTKSHVSANGLSSKINQISEKNGSVKV